MTVLTRVRRRVVRLAAHCKSGLFNMATNGRIPARIFYAAVSSRFDREQRAFLLGRRRYLDDLQSTRSSQSLLRRNVHRIEKGLCMEPRRPVFAREYVEETVNAYLARRQCAEHVDKELIWADSVLNRYFECVEIDDPRVDRASRAFRELSRLERPAAEQDGYEPTMRPAGTRPLVDLASFRALAKHRQSVRRFQSTSVPRDLLQEVIDTALLSPSACNRQPYVFRVFDEPEWVQAVSRVPMGVAGYEEQIPTIIVVVGQMRNFFDERDRHLIYIDGALASMTFMLAAESAGLATCPINWPDIESKERELSALIGLEPDERPVMLIAVGYPHPDAMVPASTKKSASNAARFNVE